MMKLPKCRHKIEEHVVPKNRKLIKSANKKVYLKSF